MNITVNQFLQEKRNNLEKFINTILPATHKDIFQQFTSSKISNEQFIAYITLKMIPAKDNLDMFLKREMEEHGKGLKLETFNSEHISKLKMYLICFCEVLTSQ